MQNVCFFCVFRSWRICCLGVRRFQLSHRRRKRLTFRTVRSEVRGQRGPGGRPTTIALMRRGGRMVQGYSVPTSRLNTHTHPVNPLSPVYVPICCEGRAPPYCTLPQVPSGPSILFIPPSANQCVCLSVVSRL